MTGDWRNAIPAEERETYRLAGLAERAHFGSRPCVLVIDVQYRTVGDEPLPIRQSIAKHYRTSCGEAGWAAVAQISKVLAAAREARVPIIYPYVAPKAKIDAGRTGSKIPSLMEVPPRGYEFVEEVAPRPEDLLIPKRHPSAFFGTALVSYLIDMKVDTLLLTGATTSGCVRATASDAFAYNFHCGVIEEAVFDRSPTSHNVNLFDIDSKYADVIPVDEALRYLASVGTRQAV